MRAQTPMLLRCSGRVTLIETKAWPSGPDSVPVGATLEVAAERLHLLLAAEGPHLALRGVFKLPLSALSLCSKLKRSAPYASSLFYWVHTNALATTLQCTRPLLCVCMSPLFAMPLFQYI